MKINQPIIAALIAVSAVIAVHSRQQTAAQTAFRTEAREYSPLYLPDIRYVKLVTLGHNTLAGDLLWFNTNSYFGRQMAEKRDVRWLATMCGLITELDRRDPHYYEFCASLLSWVAKDPQASNRILDAAIKSNPGQWKYHYLRGFNYWYFLQDKPHAIEDFSAAARLPGSPPILASLASRLMISSDDAGEAILLLRNLIQTTKDNSVRAVLFDKLKRAQISHDLSVIKSAIEIAGKRGQKIKDLQSLVSLGIITGLPADPFGGKYYLDSETGSVKTTSGEKGLDFTEHSFDALNSRKAADKINNTAAAGQSSGATDETK